MKLLELEISKIRGIKYAKLSPNGENLVVWGPNGSGKSAVVDAVDFLLTGKISRLIGEGTGGITLKDHGKHIDHDPKEAFVGALLQLPGHKNPISVKRRMSSPLKLEYPEAAAESLKPVIELAKSGQHVLSRREILRFVAAEAGKRASDVQELLKLEELESIRKMLQRVQTTGKAMASAGQSSLRDAEKAIQTTLALPSFNFDSVLVKVNELRSILVATPIKTLSSEAIRGGITVSSNASQTPTVSVELVKKDIENIDKTIQASTPGISKADEELRRILVELKTDTSTMRDVKKLDLLKLGVSMITEDGSCPLCGTVWPLGKLKDHIESHIQRAEATNKKRERLNQLGREISKSVEPLEITVNRIAESANQIGLSAEWKVFKDWSEALGRLRKSLSDPLDSYPDKGFETNAVAQFLSPPQRQVIAAKVLSEAEKKGISATPEQLALDLLTRFEENWRQHERAQERNVAADKFTLQARSLSKHFEDARDETLSALYEKIETRFSTLYRAIHSEDEGGFESTLRPEGAGLKLEVEFYGRGKFPPLALHSEGHQDTMGICLYLALAERLTGKLLNLTILDDVVMSVDAGHRRKICELLANQFPGRQFLITTHDRTWARQLTTTGVVRKGNSIEFARWTIDAGPLVTTETDLWSKIDQDFTGGDIPTAAHRLRRGAEEFFEEVCNNLQAKLRYRSDGRLELGDFAPASISSYLNYLKKAKESANSWKNKDLVEKLSELETIAKQVISRSQIEQWAINENVHYSRWGEFQPSDFRPVIEAWKDLFDLFQCTKCATLLFLTSSNGKQPNTLRCQCGSANWNLILKGKESS